MIERYITHLQCIEVPHEEETEAKRALKSHFPKMAARRMSLLGMMVGRCLQETPINEETPIVYATTYAESRALEKYLESFPYASPQGFQTSIHPSALEQALIIAKQPVREIYPLAGKKAIAQQSLKTALIADSDAVLVVGAEERGTWLLDAKVASSESFAYAFLLQKNSDNAAGTLQWQPEISGESSLSEASLHACYLALKQREPLVSSRKI